MSPLAKALVALVALASVAELATGKNYTIQWAAGGNSYGDWSAANPVRVGDTVVFTYGSPHTVHELSQPDYVACNFDKPLSQDDSGRTAITFDKAGTRYFACAVGSHCNQGQKVAITVAADGAAGGGAQSPASSPPGNSAAPMTGAAGLAVKLVLGLGVGGAVLAAF